MKRSEDVEELAMRELRILSALKHPNIIELREVVSYEGDVKVVFEYVEENLLELYESSKVGVNENQIKCILYQTAFALEYLHSEKKVIHRDIKPENILIDRKKGRTLSTQPWSSSSTSDWRRRSTWPQRTTWPPGGTARPRT